MIRPYLHDYYPPVPVLDFTLSVPGKDEWVGPFPAIVDSGADFSIVPASILEPLKPPIMREVTLSSQWKDKRAVYVYKVDIRVGNLTLVAMDVAGDLHSDEVLLGRNILNRLDLRLEGPALRLHLLE